MRYYKIRYIILIVFLISAFFVVGCRFNNQEFFIISKIDIYDNSKKNEQLGRDLILYDYSNLIIQKLKIKDQVILNNITWQYFVQSDTKDVTFRLILNNEAKAKRTELVNLFKNFLDVKLNEYRSKTNQVDSAVITGTYFIDLIQSYAYDSLWSQKSPSIEKFGSKAEYFKVFNERKSQFKPNGKMKVYSRLIGGDLENLHGDFYTITYEYEDNKREQVTLEKINNKFKFLGYKFMTPIK